MLVDALSKLTKTPITSEEYECGSDAKFLRINEKWGAKLFLKKYRRDSSHELQKKASEHGLAPAVGYMFEFATPDDQTYYGMLTECITETYGDYESMRLYGCSAKELDYYEVDEIDNDMHDDEEYQSLIEKLDEMNIDTDDMHLFNVGYMPDGRLVAIDFSRA